MIDLAGHIAYVVIICGTFLLTHKKKSGWALRVVGDLGVAVVGFCTGLTSLALWPIIFAINDSYGWYKWRKQEKE